MKTAVRSMTYPEFVQFRAEDGFSGAIVQAARNRRVSTSEFLRRIVRERLAAEGVQLPDLGLASRREAA
ncbi:hypothetical protein ABC766_12985 [Methylobacterium fujisawaense]|uniref:hypothetical protein n=1 Tax=Methylobacterium fujisawaense TaxID=107400 RepID=UPI0031F49556